MTILKSPFKSPHLGHFSRLQLPWHLHGPCLTSALARRLAAAPLPRALLPRALRALRRLAAAQLELGRQALNAARRNLMWCLGSGFRETFCRSLSFYDFFKMGFWGIM